MMNYAQHASALRLFASAKLLEQQSILAYLYSDGSATMKTRSLP